MLAGRAEAPALQAEGEGQPGGGTPQSPPHQTMNARGIAGRGKIGAAAETRQRHQTCCASHLAGFAEAARGLDLVFNNSSHKYRPCLVHQKICKIFQISCHIKSLDVCMEY